VWGSILTKWASYAYTDPILGGTMKYVFGFNVKEVQKLDLSLDELFILHTVLYLNKKEKLKFSTTNSDYFLIGHKSMYKHCIVLRHHNIQQISLYMQRLCGNAKDSITDMEYPLSSMMMIEDKKRNMYYKFNDIVIQQLVKKETNNDPDVTPRFSDCFIGQYKAITEIYDFKHRFNINKPGKILLTADKYIQQILSNTFIGKKHFDREWLLSHNVGVVKDLSFKDILDTIKQYADDRNNGWLSYHKDIPLSSFFYNPHTKKSMFIQILTSSKKETVLDFEFNEEREMYQKELEWFCKETGMDKKVSERTLYPIYIYFKEYYIRLKEQAERRGLGVEWQKKYGVRFKWNYFTADLAEFVENRKGMKAEYIGLKNKFWYSFVVYVYKKYGKLRLCFDNAFYEKINDNGVDLFTEF